MTKAEKKPHSIVAIYAAHGGKKPAQLAEIINQVPDYATASPDVRKRMDEIIKTADPLNIASADTFGRKAYEKRSTVAGKIIDAQEASISNMIEGAFKNSLSVLESHGLEDIDRALGQWAERAKNTAGNAAGVVSRNKGTLALTAIGSYALTPLAALPIGALAVMAQEKRHQLKRQQTLSKSPEQLEQACRAAISEFRESVRAIEKARDDIPRHLQEVNELGRANVETLAEVTLNIGAADEIVRRIRAGETETWNPEGNPEINAILDLYADRLERRKAVHESARNGAVIDVNVLAMQVETLVQYKDTIDGILTAEVFQHQGALAGTIMAAQALRIGNILQRFREASNRTVGMAVKATEAAHDLASQTAIDSPEVLKATLKNMGDIKRMLEQAVANQPAYETARVQLQGQIATVASQLTSDQVRVAQTVIANDHGNTPKLGNDFSESVEAATPEAAEPVAVAAPARQRRSRGAKPQNG